MKYTNPIIPGFHPDPSVCRVGRDYYLVNSTFEYFPGVPIFHSRDLAHWTQIGNCLHRPSQLPLAGAPASDGIYAPTIRHHNGRFYMATTNCVAGQGFVNFYVHADNPAGPWFRPRHRQPKRHRPLPLHRHRRQSLLDRQRHPLVPMRGIFQAEIDLATGRHLSEIQFIWPGTGGAYPESPHLFKRGDFYYLTVAEGGTADCHMVTIARATTPFGPFESCPHNPILTHRSLMNPIQATGHADLFEDHNGDWWAVFLGIRYATHGFHNLGRETFLAPVEWTDDHWPIVNHGKKLTLSMEVPRDIPLAPVPAPPVRDHFNAPALAPHWLQLRNLPAADWAINTPPSHLTLRCAPATLDQLASPAFLGRRQQHFHSKFTALLSLTPAASHEEAGLTALIDNQHHAEILLTRREERPALILRRRVGTIVSETAPVAISECPVELSITTDREWYHFAATPAGQETIPLGKHELRYLSTEVAGGYTGVILGMYATANGQESETRAHFDWCDYAALE